MNIPESFGDLLRRLRGDLTLRDVASEIKVKSPQTIGNWERGLQLLPEDKVPLLKKLYKITPESENAINFDNLYSEAKRKKSLETGPTLVDKDQGVAPMITGLENLAALAKQETDMRYVLHSVSNQGFMTQNSPDLQAALFGCAEAGVDIVFFPQPGTESPDTVKMQLKRALKTSVEDYAFKKHDNEFNKGTLLQHFSILNHKHSPPTFPLPAAQEELDAWVNNFVEKQVGSTKPKCATAISELVMSVSAAANWLGSFLRFLVEIKVQKEDEPRKPGFGSIERTCPAKFEVERIWLHLVTHSADKRERKHAWVHISDESGLFAIEYGRELAIRRQRNLLESSLISESKP